MPSAFGRRRFIAGASLVSVPLLGSSTGTASAVSPVTTAGPGRTPLPDPSQWKVRPFRSA